MTLLLYVLLAIVAAAVLFGLSVFVLPRGEQLSPAASDTPVWRLSMDRALSAEDVDAVRLPVGLRGYRFAETDELLDRLGTELLARDEEIGELRTQLAHLRPESDADAEQLHAEQLAAEPAHVEPEHVEPAHVEPEHVEDGPAQSAEVSPGDGSAPPEQSGRRQTRVYVDRTGRRVRRG